LTDPRSLPLTDQGKHTHLNRTCHKIICRKIIAPLVNRQYVDHRWDTEHFIYLTGSDKLVEQEHENRSGYRLPYALCKKRS
jgi:hypothetical protein